MEAILWAVYTNFFFVVEYIYISSEIFYMVVLKRRHPVIEEKEVFLTVNRRLEICICGRLS